MKIAHKLYLLVGGSALAYVTSQLLVLNVNEAELRLPQTMQALQNDLLVLVSCLNVQQHIPPERFT